MSVAAAFGQTGVAVSIGVSIARNAVDNNVLADVSNVTLVSLEDTTQGNPLVIEAVTGAGNLPNSIATDDNLTFAGLDAASKADDPEANPTAANDDIKTLRALKGALEEQGAVVDADRVCEEVLATARRMARGGCTSCWWTSRATRTPRRSWPD